MFTSGTPKSNPQKQARMQEVTPSPGASIARSQLGLAMSE